MLVTTEEALLASQARVLLEPLVLHILLLHLRLHVVLECLLVVLAIGHLRVGVMRIRNDMLMTVEIDIKFVILQHR